MDDLKYDLEDTTGNPVQEHPRRVTEVTIKEVEVTKLNLRPGEVLFVKLHGDDFDHQPTIESLHEVLRKTFPNNKVMVMSMPTSNDVEMIVVKGESDEPNT